MIPGAVEWTAPWVIAEKVWIRPDVFVVSPEGNNSKVL